MDKNQLTALRVPLPVKTRAGSRGMQFEYVSSSDVIDRLNDVFDGNWSSKVINVFKTDNDVVVQLDLIVGNLIHTGFGGNRIEGEVGSAYKSAKSKAIKDAAKSLGLRVLSEDDSQAEEKTKIIATPPPGYSQDEKQTQESKAKPLTSKKDEIPGFASPNYDAGNHSLPPISVPPGFTGTVQGDPQDMKVASKPVETMPPIPRRPAPGSGINEVQKSAINNALRTRKVTYEELWLEAVTELGLNPETTSKEMDSLDRTVASKMVANSHTKAYKD